MKKSTRTLISTAAITGLLTGAAIRQAHAADGDTNKTTNATGTNKVLAASGTNKVSSASSTNKAALAAGKVAPTKAPKVQSCSGENDCKGLGGCKTADHACKFKNDCKGKGGCSLDAKDIKTWEKAHKS